MDNWPYSIFSQYRQFKMVLDGKSSQEYLVTSVPQESIIGPTIFLICNNDLLDDVIRNIAIYADDAILYLSVIRHIIYGSN